MGKAASPSVRRKVYNEHRLTLMSGGLRFKYLLVDQVVFYLRLMQKGNQKYTAKSPKYTYNSSIIHSLQTFQVHIYKNGCL